jgi:neutral ceramidase
MNYFWLFLPFTLKNDFSMKFLKKIGKVLFLFVCFLIVLSLFVFKKIDRTPYQQTERYQAWKKEIAKADFTSQNNPEQIKVGWAKRNITPLKPGPMAGYGVRKGKAFSRVHDSLFVRVLAVKNTTKTIFILSADMLIIPPNVTEILAKRLKIANIAIENVHLGSTHSHNSIGGWGNSIAGRMFAGGYDPNVEIVLAEQFYTTIIEASKNCVAASITYSEAIDNEDVRNRLPIKTPTSIDPEIRMIDITRTDGKKAKLVSYAAHSTVLNATTYEMSRDYSGLVVDSLEKNQADFALFMAGAVGSMGPVEKGNDDFDEVKNQANGVLKHIFENSKPQLESNTNDLWSTQLNLPMNDASPRISLDWGLRPWVFKALFGDYPNYIKITKINNILMVGLPCDFSGELMAELDQYAQSKGLNLVVTSFNGTYIGYVPHDKHFETAMYETISMSWFGYQNGAYFSEVIKDVIDKVAKRGV